MDSELIIELEELRQQVNCANGYRCVKESLNNYSINLCSAISGTMSCLESKCKDCPYMKEHAHSYVCRCPLRKFIILNFPELTGYNFE